MHVVHEICNQYSIIAGYLQRPRMNEAFAEKAEESAAEVHVGNLFNSQLLSVSDSPACDNLSKKMVAEAPWSAAEWAVALLFVKLLQAQPGRQAR